MAAGNQKSIANSIIEVKFKNYHAKDKFLPRTDIIKESNRYIADIDEKIKIAVSQGATKVTYNIPKTLELPHLDENKRAIVTRAVFKNVIDRFKDETGAGYTVKYTQLDANRIQLEFSGWMPDEIFTDSKKFMEYVNK